jgi:GTP pyrophosphokinase
MVHVVKNLPDASALQDRVPQEWLDIVEAKLSTKGADQVRTAVHFSCCALCAEEHNYDTPEVSVLFAHVLNVAAILFEMTPDHEVICAALLHGVLEAGYSSLDVIHEQFGVVISDLVSGVMRMGFMHEYQETSDYHQEHSESLRNMLLAMAKDVRVVFIKLAERLQVMRELKYLPVAQQQKIAVETREIIAPLANRLGIWQIKWELEDLAFRYLQKKDYHQLANSLSERRVDRERVIEESIGNIRKALEKAGVDATINGRSKHLYSIWRKMKRKRLTLRQLYDLHAVRILVKDIPTCYAVLGIIHNMWQHIPQEFDDYIANPKPNNYRSLHTAIRCLDQRVVEVQIRTLEMHEHSEMGIASHWRYKEGGLYNQALEEKIGWLRQLLDWKDDVSDRDMFIERFHDEIREHRIYVFTPENDIIELPEGATALDFAYKIHTELGHRTRGTHVNGRIQPLSFRLETGMQVSLLTTKLGNPTRDWLNPHLGYLKTSRAKNKVKAWFKRQDRQYNIVLGHEILDREFQHLNAKNVNLEKLAAEFSQSVDDFLAAVGQGDIGSGQVSQKLGDSIPPLPKPKTSSKKTTVQGDVSIHGVGNLLTRVASCCAPVPPEAIIGFITQGRGVTIHRDDCPNAAHLSEQDSGRMIQVCWEENETQYYPVNIQVTAYDRSGLLRDITSLLASEKINLQGANTHNDEEDYAIMHLSLEIQHINQLSRVLDKLLQIPNIINAVRM